MWSFSWISDCFIKCSCYTILLPADDVAKHWKVNRYSAFIVSPLLFFFSLFLSPSLSRCLSLFLSFSQFFYAHFWHSRSPVFQTKTPLKLTNIHFTPLSNQIRFDWNVDWHKPARVSSMFISIRNNKQNGRRIRVNSIKIDFKLDKSIECH